MDPGNVTFFSSGNAGDLGFIEFSTGAAVNLGGIRLYAASDGSGLGNRRSMQAFRFLADADNNGSFEMVLVDVPVNVGYGGVQVFTEDDPSRAQIQVALLFGAVNASSFRYEVNQGVSFSQFDGVRVQEIDAIEATVPEPATVALLGLGLIGLGFRRRKV